MFVALLVLGGLGCNSSSNPENSSLGVTLPAGQESVGVGELAPEFVLENFEGEVVRLSDFKGKPIFIDFWAGWCPFCVGELPEIEKTHQEYGDDLVVLGIHRTDTESVDVGKKFADKHGATYPLLKDEDGSAYNTFTGGRPFMPVSIFIDSNGIIQDLRFGPKTAEQIHESILKISE